MNQKRRAVGLLAGGLAGIALSFGISAYGIHKIDQAEDTLEYQTYKIADIEKGESLQDYIDNCLSFHADYNEVNCEQIAGDYRVAERIIEDPEVSAANVNVEEERSLFGVYILLSIAGICVSAGLISGSLVRLQTLRGESQRVERLK